MISLSDVFGAEQVMVILRGLPPTETVAAAHMAWDAGVELVEVPIGGTGDVASLAAAVRAVEFGLYDWQSALTLMQEHGPTELIRQVRAAERADPIGSRWPRNKQSDDAAVVFGMT